MTRLIAAALVLLLVAAAQASGQSNVVVIISDDAGWADYGFMRSADPAADPGNRGAVPTPSLGALAARGVVFTQAYTASVCAPSRAMITTGKYGGRFGYTSNILGGNGAINNTNIPQGLPTSVTTGWEYMQGAGYDTAAIGKWHIGAHASGGGQLGNRPEHQGVEFFQGLWSGSRDYWVGGQSGDGQLRETVSDGAGGVNTNQVIEGNYSGQYVTDVFGDQSADYIKGKAGGADPFFLYSSFTAPHTPMQATASDLAFIDSLNEPGFTGNRRTYAAMQYAMDRNVGKILDALEDPAGDGNAPGNDSDNILDDTLIIFINDNGGDCCDSSPNASDNGDLRHGKGSQFEGGMRVPMIVAGAGVNQTQWGNVSQDLVHAIDIVPTALIGAGGGSFAPGDVIDGVNLLPYINGTTSGVAHDNLLITRFNNQQSAVRMGNWKYMYQNGTGYQLYDLDNDIDENNNVVSNPANAAVVQQAHELLASYHVQLDKPRHDNQADDTNQFDHFRFREDALGSATFSAANAWTNGDTGSGNFTASWRDGYANNQITFRAKATGDYQAINDLTSVGGFAYMANRINLTSATAALATAQTGTINGAAVMMTNNLNGDGPQINLDATDVSPDTFTFKVDLDVEVYDDLTIRGDGNQNFQINSQVREFRSGRNVTKTGSSNLTLGGGVDISGTLDLQGGDVSFTHGQVRGNVVAQTGSSVIVGGVGFNETAPPPPGPSIVTTDLDLNFDAALDTSGDANWTDAQSGQNLSFAAAATVIAVNDGTFPTLSAAYHIPATGGATGLANYFENTGPRSQKDATFELWFNVASTTAGGDQVLFEAGGTDRGVSFLLNDDLLSFNVNGDGAGSTTFALSETLGAGWHQAVGVIDLAPSGDSIALYVDNALVGTLDQLDIGDWSGGNNTGVGQVAGVLGAGGSPVNYHDAIAVARYYRDLAFSAAEVNQNYQWATFDPGVGITSPTQLTIDGDYTQLAGASLVMDVFDPANFDALNVTGTFAAAGTLQVDLVVGAPAPQLGDLFDILDFDSAIGAFDTISLPVLDPGLAWDSSRLLITGELQVIAKLAGDLDSDGFVGINDLNIILSTWNQNVSPGNSLEGDPSGDGFVGIDDLNIVLGAWNTGSPPSGIAAIPEPGSFLLMAASTLTLLNRCALP